MSAVVIIGLGVTGLACCRHYLKQNITPVILDTRTHPPLIAQLPHHVPFMGHSTLSTLNMQLKSSSAQASPYKSRPLPKPYTISYRF